MYHFYAGNGSVRYHNCPFISASYNIDLLYKKPRFKLFAGGQLGTIIYPGNNPSQIIAVPGAGINFMMNIPATKTTSFYFDIRTIMSLTPIVRGLNYSTAPDGEYRRVFTINLTFGCKFNMFSKKKNQEGLTKYEELKAAQSTN